jgi:hypothetical protein
MAIPNEIYFGPENITFGDVRTNHWFWHLKSQKYAVEDVDHKLY